jgi:hypothetical protein
MNWRLWVWKLRNLRYLLRGAPGVLVGRVRLIGRLYVIVFRADGGREDYGLVSTRVVTTAGVNYLVDAFQGTTEPENFKYHGMGTGNTAEAVGDTALVTEVESRATGTQTEGASANIYRTVATITATTARAIVEHGIFSASSAGTLLDRSVFSVINLSTSDSIQFTYELTLPAGS